MSAFSPRILKNASRQLKKLDPPIAKRIVEQITWLAQHFDKIKPEALLQTQFPFSLYVSIPHAIIQWFLNGGTMRMLHAFGLAFCLILMSVPASAQWVDYRDPRTPRTADGKPNLTAPAPKLADGTPDFSGIWRRPDNKYLQNLGADGIEILMQPWAEKLYKERQENNSRDWPNGRCLPNSVTDSDGHQTPRKIIQQPGLIVLLFETYHYYRQIFTDGRPLPDEREPAWFGYSVGKWDRDTLVVDTVGLKENTWLDFAGHPHSDALHIIERFRRTDFGHIQVEVTVDDPKAYRKPWTARIGWELLPDTDLLDWVCENEKDFLRLSGK